MTEMPDIRHKLLRAIKNRPILWASEHPQYKNRLYQKQQWEQVVAELPASSNINVDSVKKQWKNLRDTYRKELRRPYQQWQFCDEMSFVKEELLKTRRAGSPSGWTQNNFTPYEVDVTMPQDENQDSDDSFEKSAPEHLIDNEDPFGWSPKKSPTDDNNDRFSASEQDTGENIQVNASDFIIDKLACSSSRKRQSMPTSQPDSADYHFLMSILPEMEKLPPMQNMRLRAKINAALMQEMSISYDKQQNSTQAEKNNDSSDRLTPKRKRKDIS